MPGLQDITSAGGDLLGTKPISTGLNPGTINAGNLVSGALVAGALLRQGLSLSGFSSAPPDVPVIWTEAPEAWDAVSIGDLTFSGLASISVRKASKTDPKSAVASDSNSVTHLGYEPAQITITLRMWEQEHLNDYARILAMVQPHNKDPQAVHIYHPLLALHNVTTLYVVLIDPPKPTAVWGVWEAALVGQEWKPQQGRHPLRITETLNTPEVSNSSVGIVTRPRPPSQSKAGP